MKSVILTIVKEMFGFKGAESSVGKSISVLYNSIAF